MVASFTITVLKKEEEFFSVLDKDNDVINSFLSLYINCQNILQNNDDAEQAFAIETSDGRIYSFVNYQIVQGNHADETQFLDMLRMNKATHFIRSLLLWNDGTMDIPSSFLRNALRTLDARNIHALHLVGDKLITYNTMK